MRNFGALEIGLIVVAIVLIFGIGKLGQVGGALGKSIREFRRERDKKDGDSEVASADAKSEKSAGKSEAKSAKEKLPELRQQDSSERQILHGVRGQDGGLQLEAS
jgi:sec-independent protein translocase protein TatA